MFVSVGCTRHARGGDILNQVLERVPQGFVNRLRFKGVVGPVNVEAIIWGSR